MTTIQAVPATGYDAEQTRARYPDAEGYVDQDGVRVFWERYGEGESAILFLPTWEIVPSRVWKCQIPYFSRRCRVVTFDPRGNGRSDRPRDVRCYDRRRYAEDAIAVLDAAGVERAAVVSWCGGSEELMLAVVIQGTADEIVGPERGGAVAAAIGGARLVTLQGCGHGPHARDPVKVNQLIRDFVCPPPPVGWTRGQARRKRAIYISSPIGLGHARRDIAIADELRALRPGLQIEWLAQHPVTAVLEARGERIHPLSAQLANESRHIQRESRGHELHCFQALRRMDEILLANYMVFHDLVRQEPFDLWIGDEAWELDYYLHENPEEKRAPFAWLTDFVGYLPMPEGGRREADLTADDNAEMIEQIARYPHVRDRAIFVGEADDIVPDRFGPGLPLIRDWTAEHFSFSGYITGFQRASIHDRADLRRQLGYREDERICVVSVGGSGVGCDLLQRVIAAYPEARESIDGLRMVVVAGPRIDAQSLPAQPGVEVHGYVDELYRHLAASDLAIVHGGLSTCMELAASRTPFLYFPLHNHFEQDRHVDHRLRRYRAGRRLDYRTASTSVIATAIVAELHSHPDYLPVPDDGAARAARMVAELL